MTLSSDSSTQEEVVSVYFLFSRSLSITGAYSTNKPCLKENALMMAHCFKQPWYVVLFSYVDGYSFWWAGEVKGQPSLILHTAVLSLVSVRAQVSHLNLNTNIRLDDTHKSNPHDPHHHHFPHAVWCVSAEESQRCC